MSLSERFEVLEAKRAASKKIVPPPKAKLITKAKATKRIEKKTAPKKQITDRLGPKNVFERLGPTLSDRLGKTLSERMEYTPLEHIPEQIKLQLDVDGDLEVTD
ncbi:hypothetical protein HDV01_005920 [Terramyces sp. JEL0728]|nr:hypothetical protein HDV01_005920 [Terramyces sp. JEL0728]